MRVALPPPPNIEAPGIAAVGRIAAVIAGLSVAGGIVAWLRILWLRQASSLGRDSRQRSHTGNRRRAPVRRRVVAWCTPQILAAHAPVPPQSEGGRTEPPVDAGEHPGDASASTGFQPAREQA
jgi:hypothetical protein